MRFERDSVGFAQRSQHVGGVVEGEPLVILRQFHVGHWFTPISASASFRARKA